MPGSAHNWKEIFENYQVAIDATGDWWREERKCAVLLQCLGAEGLKVFYTLPNTGQTVTDAFKALEEHFTTATNVVVERHKFRQRESPRSLATAAANTDGRDAVGWPNGDSCGARTNA